MPYIEVDFGNDAPLLIEVGTTHTVQVVGPDNRIQNSFGLDGVTALALQPGDVPAAEPEVTPEPVVDVPAEPAAEPPATDAPPADPPAADAPPEPDAPPAPDPVPDPAAAAEAQAAAEAAAAAAVQTATDTVIDTTIPTPVVVDHLSAAQADVVAALATFPDSAPLLDAKAQLDALAAQVTPPPAA